jgi:hypothetical protein
MSALRDPKQGFLFFPLSSGFIVKEIIRDPVTRREFLMFLIKKI